jgi:hypothetical protein
VSLAPANDSSPDVAVSSPPCPGLALVFVRLAPRWIDGGSKPRWVIERTFAWLGRNMSVFLTAFQSSIAA